ncbi:MAG TPA: hypothetical protein VMF06_20635 [Candidatus Limnocylindria bacterium]|nr:hypothetical protein [Candidatus Limnocylindria bacterium]
MKTNYFRLWTAAAGLLWLGLMTARAQEQFQGVCSRVKIVIAQELTIERIGYEATLEVTDNDGNDPITDFSAQLTFENPLISTNGITNDASAFFFVQQPRLENINDVGGAGVIAPTTKAVTRWFIIPKPGAGGKTPNGIVYRVGCVLSGKIRGQQIPADVLFAVPATITVKPEPLLEITYFQPRDVQGDDPFTADVESPVPFTLGVLVKNVGYAPAKKLNIDSQQPKIVENKNGLLLVAQLLGARVNDSPLDYKSLQVNLGDIAPGTAKKGAWDMITSLSGTFTEFKASYTHASELGGQDTSLIKSLNAYFIAHEVLNDQAGRDGIKDFLADTLNDEDNVPNALFESEGNELPVNYHTNAVVIGTATPGGSLSVHLDAQVAGWGYIRVDDPGQSRLKLGSITRSDGKVLNVNNYWTSYRYTRIGNIRQNFINIFDLVDLQSYTYTVNYAPSENDVTPPVTSIHFAGAATDVGGKTIISPDTQIYFLSEDAQPVSIVYSLTNGPFIPALPFSIPTPGEYQIVYYATDASHNQESNKTNILVVSGVGSIDFASATLPSQPIFAPGDALSVRPASAPLVFSAAANPSPMNARVDVFSGVQGWATVAGVPSSPTRATAAALTVGGDNVGFYKYRLNNGAWSAEQPVVSPISLTGLAAGNYTVAVLGRSGHGDYLNSSNAVSVAWKVDPAAPATVVTGTPATPTHGFNAPLLVAGTGVTAYRWTVDNGYYRAETPLATPLTLTSLDPGDHTVAVLGKVSGTFQPTNNPTTVTWKIDPGYGYGLPGTPLVRSVAFTNVGTTQHTFAWDGRDDHGVIQPAGWYTLRVTLSDQLGHSNFVTKTLQIGDLAGSVAVLADATRGPKNPHARVRWAVWQDQSGGNWQIYAQDLWNGSAPIRALTSGLLAQENPRTDGRYVVWQARQANGNWDILMADLESTNAPVALTRTSTRDEVSPTIDWPWVVYQSKASSSPSDPWLLKSLNLATLETASVYPSTQDELDPDVQGGRVVWADQRDVGQGEIYFKNLESGEFRRLTTNGFGQYHPAIFDQWIVWQDNRNSEVDIYGYDLQRNTEVRVTSTPEDEARPKLDGPWLIEEENSLGPLTANVRVVHLPSGRSVPVTRTPTLKAMPALASGRAVWLETQNNQSQVVAADLPSLQAVFQNRNAVAVTPAMASFQGNAFSLLALWHDQAGITEITHYKTLTPAVVTESAGWTNGAPAGANFSLTAGDFLWIKFDARNVLDLGVNTASPLNLAAGVNVFGYTSFPSQFSAYALLEQLGLNNARGVRMLDAESGRWVTASVVGNQMVGDDFAIPGVAVLLVDVASPVNGFKPGKP